MFHNLMCLAILQSCTGIKNMPVFLIDHDKVMSHLTLDSNPLETVNADFFTEIVIDAMKRTSCVIIFAEETLCTEDISMKDKYGTPFPYLHKGITHRKVLYLPSVSEPYNLLGQVMDPQPYNSFHLGHGEKLQLSHQINKHLYIYFKYNTKLTRTEVLREHDMIMKEVYFIISQLQAGPVVAFYTGKVNPVSAEPFKYLPKVEAEAPEKRGVMIATPDALFLLNGMLSSTQMGRLSFDKTPEVETQLRTRRTLITTMQYSDFHLQFNFEFEEKNWKLANVALLEAGDEVGRTDTAVAAPWDRSYYCAEPITIFNNKDGSYITLSEYQIEALSDSRKTSLAHNIDNNEIEEDSLTDEKNKWRRSDQEEDITPGPPQKKTPKTEKPKAQNSTANENSSVPVIPAPSYDTVPPGKCSFSKHVSCGPYFNIPILAALFIFLMFMVICMWGVLMLFNCGTNSRFDDPSQKPLVIAQEVRGG